MTWKLDDELIFDRSGMGVVIQWVEKRGEHRVLHDTWAMHIDPGPGDRIARRMAKEIEAAREERAILVDLIEDLATTLASTVVGWENVIGHDLAEAPGVQRVMARYRNWRHETEHEQEPSHD